MIYLDNAAATPLDKQVLAAMEPYFAEKFYNPSATYLASKAVRSDIESARKSVAAVLGVRSNEIIFTAGGTEANNLAIHGIMRQYPGAKIIVSAIEHESVLEPAGQYDLRQAPVDTSGIVDLDALEHIIDDKTVLVSVMYANNEVGSVQSITRIASMLKSIRQRRVQDGNITPLYLHTDACQASNYLNLRGLQVDMMTLNGGKIYGPKQSGVLFCRSGLSLQPQILGGGQERGRRSGTENTAQIIGFSVALNLAQEIRVAENKRLSELLDYAQKLISQKLPTAIINGSTKQRLPNNLHLTFPGQDNERLMIQLDELGIMCAVGSACSASSEEPSHVLRAMGLSDEAARASLRFTMGRSTTQTDLHSLVQALINLVN